MSDSTEPLEFTVTRRGEPILFIHGLVGVTWANEEIVFKRPIEKLGKDLILFQGESLLTDDPVQVLRIVAHWKKRVLKRTRSTGLPIEELILTGDFHEFD